jgi:hypothetical protein
MIQREPPSIHFYCTSSEHRRRARTERVDTLTVHDGRWAYCPFDVRSDGHAWSETGGLPLVEIERRAREEGIPVSSLPQNEFLPAPEPPAPARSRGASASERRPKRNRTGKRRGS